MEIKPHDWFATLMYQPDLSIERMRDIGILPSTASMKSRDEYKNIKAVIENPMFSDENGSFDEKKFNSFYDSALLLYNQTSELEYLDKIESSYEYDPWAWYAADKTKKRNTEPVGIINPNPWRTEYGINGLGTINPGKFSAREIAQDQYYYDSEKGEFSNEKPNDFVGILKSFKAPRLVLDTYDEDTTELINGKEVVHQKGSFKLNEYGAPYYRTLKDNEEIYDKDLLHVTDIWSTDGVGINKYDPFDSDGLTTEPWKVAVKNILRVAPFLIGGEVGLVIKGLSAAAALFEFMPTFLKAVDGIATNDAMDNEFGRKMNQLETWLGRLDNSVSDRSREKLVTFENIGNMFADVTAQLFQQKAVARLPQSKLFKNWDWMRNNAKVGRALSYAYMSMTSSEEAYSIFKNAGANDATAGLAMLALMGVYYKLMSSDYFKDVLFKGTWLDESQYKRITWSVLQDFKNSTLENTVNPTASPEIAKQTFNWFQKAWEKAISSIPVEGKGFLQGALSEGVEETMEEVGIDALKGLASGMNALGIPVTTEDTDLDFGYSWDDVKTRYLTSFFGGAFGGAVFHGYNLMDPSYRQWLNTSRELAKTPDGRITELVNLATQGRLNDVKRYATKLAQKGLVGNDNLSGTLFETIDSVDGKTDVAASSEKSISQNQLVYDAFMKQINFIEAILADEGFLKAREQITNTLKLDKTEAGVRLFESLGVNDIIMHDVTRLGTEIVKIRAKMQAIADSLRPTDENYDKTEYEKKVKNNEEYKQYEEQLKELRQEFDDLLKAKNISRYVTPAVLVRNNPILKAMLGYSNIDEFTQAKYYGKHFEDFTPAQQLIIQQQYEAYKDGEKKNIFEISEIYRVLGELMSNDLMDLDKKYKDLQEDKSVEVTTYGNQYISRVLEKSQLYSRKTQLETKENKTDEDLEEIAKLTRDLSELEEEINTFKDNPNLAINQIEKQPIVYSSIQEGAQALLDYYKSFIGKFKYSDGELDSFFNDLRKHYLNLNVRAITEEWIASKDVYDDDPESFYRQSEETPIRKEFYNLLSKFYSELWIDNDGAKATYNAIVDLLSNRAGMSEEDIESLLTNQVATGETENETRPDGSIVTVRLVDSLIPQVNNSSILKYIDELNKVRSQIVYSDLLNVLTKFSVATEDTELIDIMKALQDEEYKILGNLENYRIGDPLIQSKLEKASLYLNTIFAEIAGAGNGVNKLINEYRKKEGKELLAEISDETRTKLLNHLNMLNNRVKFVIDLHELNSGQKMRQQKDTGVNMRVKFLQNFKENVYVEEFKKEFGFDPSEIIKDIDLDHIVAENFDQYEKEIIDIESKFYDKIQSLHLSEADLAKKIVSVFGKNSAWRQRSTKFTADKKLGVTDYDQIIYAASIFSLHSGAFYYKIKSILEELQNEGEIEIAPVFPQEHALRIIYSFAHNKELFNNIINAVKSSYDGSEAYVINKLLLNNMISVFGGAGTGKTQGVGFFLSKLFDNVEFLFVGPTQNQVKRLLDVFDAKEEQGKTFDQFFSAVAPQYLNSSNFKYDSKTQSVVAKDPSLTFKDWWSTENDKVRILLVDEAGLANSHQLSVFSRYAEHFGGYVVTLGDTKQNTAKLTFEQDEKTNPDGTKDVITSTEPDGFEDTFGIRTPPLKATFRAENRAKADNYVKLDQRVEDVDDKTQSSETPIEAQNRDKLVETINTALDYYIYDDHISGDYITKDEAEFKQLLDKLIKSGNNRILLITDSETAKKYQDPKYDQITRQDAFHAQGGEFQYVFVDKTISDSKYDNLKDLYTTSQRATLASIVLDLKENYQGLGIRVHERRDSDLPYVIPDDERKAFISWRVNSLKPVEKPDNYEELIKIPINEKVNTTNTIKKSESKPTPEPDPNLNQKPPKKEEPVAEKKQETNPVAEIKKEEKAEEPKETRQTADEESNKSKVIPLVNSTTPKEEFVDKTPTEEEYEDELEEEETPSEQTWAASQDFFNLIYKEDDFRDFFNSETSNPSSLWSFINNNGLELKKDGYKNLLLVLHRAVMNNVSVKDAIAQSRFNIPAKDERLLKRIFQDENLIYSLWNINTDGKSNITLVVTNQIDTKFQFSTIVGTMKGIILPNGRFSDNTKFNILTKPRYEKNGKEWITIKQLKERFPWLNIYSIGGIPINSDTKQASSVYNAKTKAYLKGNDGKCMAFASDNGNVDEDLILQTTTLDDGTLYLHNFADVLNSFGVQERVGSKKIATYAACIYYLSNKGYDFNNNKSENLFNALVNLGVFSKDTKTPTDDICKYLYSITKNNSWYELSGLMKENTQEGRKQYYDKLRECCMESPIITAGTSERIISDLLGGILNEDPELSDLRLTNLYYEFTKKEFHDKNDPKITHSKRAVLILNQKYMIKSRQDGNDWKLELYECQPIEKSYNIVGSALASYDLKAASFNNVLKQLVNKFGELIGGMQLNQFNSYNVEVQYRTENITNSEVTGYYSLNPTATLYALFGYSFVSNDNFETVLNPNRFKYGINGAIVKSGNAVGDQMAPAKITDDMVTNASNWEASTYSFNGTIINGTLEDPNTANRTILYNQAVSWLSQMDLAIGKTISDFDALGSELTERLKHDPDLNDDSLEQYFKDFINVVNTKLLENTFELKVIQFNLENGELNSTILSEENDDSNIVKTYAYNNIVKSFGDIDPESTNEIIFSYNGVDVVSNSDRVFVIYKTPTGTLQALETKTYNAWKAAWDYISGLNDVVSGGSARAYLFNLLTNSVTDSQVESYMNFSSSESVNINRFINEYLEQRLMNEEC